MKHREIFVFGSNLAGRHGKGAALEAMLHWGAQYGKAFGLQGESFAIPTKDRRLKPLPLEVIRTHVEAFVRYAVEHPEMSFRLTPIGAGLAGYAPSQIAWMFADAPDNVIIPPAFAAELQQELLLTRKPPNAS